jgi:hydroxyacylglutathione hydrolase
MYKCSDVVLEIGGSKMKFRRYYLESLSLASYLIGDEATGRAVVVDPQRDVSQYLADAEDEGMTIELVLETHFHADFLSGHLEIAAATGAEIGYSTVADAAYPIQGFADGERYSLGEVTLEIRHTPGHTPESMCVVVYEHAQDDEPRFVLTGDTLFVGDVGRPDLLGSLGITPEEQGANLYESLHRRLLTLPDDTRVYPAHGAGSACGRNLSAEPWSTIGAERRGNYALAEMSKDEFITAVTEHQPPVPGYFLYDAIANRKDRPVFDETATVADLSFEEVLDRQREGAVILDTRNREEFAAGHVQGSINVGLEGRFAELAGCVIPPDTDIVLVAPPPMDQDARVRVGRIGYDRIVGRLADHEVEFAEHRNQLATSTLLSQEEAAELLGGGATALDVRNPDETETGMIPGAINVPLALLPSRLAEFLSDTPVLVYCQSGYRSAIAASLLRSAGAEALYDLAGGLDASPTVAVKA